MSRLLTIPFLFLAACAAGSPNRTPAVEEAAREKTLRDEEAKRRDFKAVLIRLDQSIDSYVKALADQGEFRADQQQERLYRLVQETVLDLGPQIARKGDVKNLPMPKQGETLVRLQNLATDATNPEAQAIALTALGFSGQTDQMPLILQGAQLRDPFVVDHAVLGLAVLRAPNTPPGVLAAIAERPEHPLEGRVQAAWALYRIQTACEVGKMQPINDVWLRFLANRDTLPAGVLVSAARGLGFARDKTHAAALLPALKHPTPRVRMAAAVALGRMNAQEQWRELLELIGPAETVPNVRLAASKALAALAGGADHQYDVVAWRKTFERSGS
ncbi:MAG: HEAT repeat domain-containing protein [Planctomycetes bacterium]|nr:HEAT repeat domain-containing protein [Planctomycetota bacterium]